LVPEQSGRLTKNLAGSSEISHLKRAIVVQVKYTNPVRFTKRTIVWRKPGGKKCMLGSVREALHLAGSALHLRTGCDMVWLFVCLRVLK
jgi:hypothetical protein